MRCERCAAPISGRFEIEFEVFDSTDADGVRYEGDLCVACTHSVIEFIQGKKNKQSVNAS